MNTLSPCKMIKYKGKLRPEHVKRWSSCLVLLLVSPFLMWFIIILRWLVSLPIFVTPAPCLHATLLTLSGIAAECVGHAWHKLPCVLSAPESEPGVPLGRIVFTPEWKDFHPLLLKTSCHPLKKSSFDDERALPYLTWVQVSPLSSTAAAPQVLTGGARANKSTYHFS